MYVDGYVVAVKTAKKDEYIAVARLAAQVFKDHGALTVVECWGDDVPYGKLTSFPRAVQLEEDEAVVFSWITYPDKATRDACMKKSMEDPRMKHEDMPFDSKRMIFGGFESIVEA